MATAVKPQAIAGVSPTRETLLHTVYPSIAATGFGRGLGQLFDCIPTRIWGTKVSHLIFPLPLAPVAALGYLGLKVFGQKYNITNRSVQICKALGQSLLSSIPLSSIDRVEVREEPGQAFYPAADIYLLNAKGESLGVLPGVTWPASVKELILKARNAQRDVASSLATINARHK